MWAVVCDRYGPPEVLRITEVPTPVPGDDEVLIRGRVSTVNSGDVRVRGLKVPAGLGIPMRLALGFLGPRNKILGFDIAGEVAAVGRNVRLFKPGDRVMGSRGGFRYGGHAEYAVVAEDGCIAIIPKALSYSDAIALGFGGTTALEFFRLANLNAGETILINGATGAVGVMAVQLAKHMGAEVTAVCSARNAALVRSLGADHVIDYAAEDFTRSGKTYDLVMDNHGNAPLGRVKHLLKPGGRFLMVIFANLWEMVTTRGKGMISVSDDSPTSGENYRTLLSLAEKGVLRPVIDSTYPVEQIAEAHRRVDTGHKVGSVVVTLAA